MLNFIANYSVWIFVAYGSILLGTFLFVAKGEKGKQVFPFVVAIFQGLIVIVWVPAQVERFFDDDMTSKAMLFSPIMNIHQEAERKRAALVLLEETRELRVNDKYGIVLMGELSSNGEFYKHYATLLEKMPRSKITKENKKRIHDYLNAAKLLMNTSLKESLETKVALECIVKECLLIEKFKKSIEASIEFEKHIKPMSSLISEIENDVHL